MSEPAFKCADCGATFTEGEVQPRFECSRTHRSGFKGAGHYIDCPACGRHAPVTDLRSHPSPDPHPSVAPVLRRIDYPLYRGGPRMFVIVQGPCRIRPESVPGERRPEPVLWYYAAPHRWTEDPAAARRMDAQEAERLSAHLAATQPIAEFRVEEARG